MKETRSLPNDVEILEPGEVRPLFCTRRGLKTLFGIEAQTAANWACQGIGPRYYRCGKLSFYNVDETSEYITRHPVETNREGKL